MTALALRMKSWLPRFDGAVAAILIVLALMALLNPPLVEISLRFMAHNLVDIAPFLLASVAIAASATASGADNLIAKAFTGREAQMIIVAALFGALSPFCSCGVIPLIAALLGIGVPLAPVMAFWLASPIMDPSMFVLTAGTLGTGFAVGKTLAAIGIGMFGGYVTLALGRSGQLVNPLREGVGNGGCGGSKVRDPKPVVWSFWKEPVRREKFVSSAISTTLFLGKWLALAYLLESVMIETIPADFIKSLVGGGGFLTVLGATVVGVPAYLNGYAALPLVSGLVDQGMALGAAMAFLVAGGVTSIPAAIAVWAVAKPRVFALYIGFALVGSFTAGLLFQLWAGA